MLPSFDHASWYCYINKLNIENVYIRYIMLSCFPLLINHSCFMRLSLSLMLWDFDSVAKHWGYAHHWQVDYVIYAAYAALVLSCCFMLSVVEHWGCTHQIWGWWADSRPPLCFWYCHQKSQCSEYRLRVGELLSGYCWNCNKHWNLKEKRKSWQI